MSMRSLALILSIGLCAFLWPNRADCGFMGVFLEKSEDEGALRINDLVANSPATMADLKTGDLITHFCEIPVGDVERFIEFIRGRNAGDEVTLLIMRGDKRMQMRVRLIQSAEQIIEK